MTPQELANLPEIAFTTNWNQKLFCSAFTTIRLQNPKKFVVGRVYKIVLKGKIHSVARCHAIHKIEFNQLTDSLCYLDTGYNKEVTSNIFEKMYTKQTCEQIGLAVILLVKKNFSIEYLDNGSIQITEPKK